MPIDHEAMVLINAGIDVTDDNREQLRVCLEAVRTYSERTQTYGQVWRQYGALSNLLSSARKVDRLMEGWWHDGAPPLHKDGLDDAIDLINYTVFFMRNAREANFVGDRPKRPAHSAPDPAEHCTTCGMHHGIHLNDCPEFTAQ